MATPKKTSIGIDPKIWEEFKEVARQDGRSATKQLEREMIAAINRHNAQKKLKIPSVAGDSPSTSVRGVTPPSSFSTPRPSVVVLENLEDVSSHFSNEPDEDLARVAEDSPEKPRRLRKTLERKHP